MRKLPVEIIKDKSGVTLVELIIGIVMFSILTISVSLIFAPTLDIYVQVNELAELNSLANNIANQIAADLTRAGDVRIIGDGTANEILEMDIAGAVTDYKVDSNGLAAKNSKLLMGAPYYKHKTVDIKYEELQINNKPTSYNIVIAIMDKKGKPLFSRLYSVKSLMLEANQYN